LLGIRADDGVVRSGEFRDLTISHFYSSPQQATYTLFSANDDAVCIAYAAIAWPSGEKIRLGRGLGPQVRWQLVLLQCLYLRLEHKAGLPMDRPQQRPASIRVPSPLAQV
jgi:hypothetical protein